jgi:hypothetical protein
MSSYKCFMMPSVSPPQNAPYTVWYVAWFPDQPGVTWSSLPLELKPGMISTWVGAAAQDAIPEGATVVGDFTKEIPPPPSALAQTIATVADFQQAFTQWLSSRPLTTRGLATRSA